MIKRAVVSESTPCVDANTNKEKTYFDGEKIATTSKEELVKLSTILNTNELEITKPVY